MAGNPTLGEALERRGVSRRALLKYASYVAALMALPPAAASAIAEGLAKARRQSVIWLSFQECTGCTESLTRSFSPTLENLIFDFISLDYHHTLQAASGEAAEEARARRRWRQNKGKYVVVVDGAVPTKDGGVYSTIAGVANIDMLAETGEGRARGRRGRLLRRVRRHPQGQAQSDRRRRHLRTRRRQAGHQHFRLPADTGGDGRRARLHRRLRQVARTRSSRPPQGVFRRDHPRPLLPPPVLRARPVRRRLRRRGRAQGLLPLQARLQGTRPPTIPARR